MIDAEIKYIKAIPANWMVKRIKESFDIIDELREPITADQRSQENPIYDYYGASGVIDKIDYFNVNDKVLLIGEDGANLVSRNLPLIYKAGGKFWVNNHAHILKPYKNKYDYNYCAYALEATDYTVFITGSAQPKLNQLNLGRVLIPFPPFREQQAIANYLDTKCSKIDASVATLKEMKDKYLSLKKSLINETVCRGLNKDVPLKSSGIDWIGDIPEHWEVKRIKDLVSVNSDVLSENTNKNYVFKYIDISSVSSGGKISISEEYVFGEAPSRARRIIKKNDIIVSTVRTYLQAIAQIDWDVNDTIVSTGFAVLSPNEKTCTPSYLFYAIKNEVTINEIMRLSIGVSYPAITAYDLCNIPIALPPLFEQHSIATYFDSKCSKIDSIVANIDSQIEAYTKLKKSLISEVVTGKKRVI